MYIGIGAMQPFEAQAFASYMARNTLFVDVWDADALMHVGTLALQLRTLMRQQKGVVKTAMVREEGSRAYSHKYLPPAMLRRASAMSHNVLLY